MKTFALMAVLVCMPQGGGEPGNGLQLYAAGKWPEAAAAFKAAIARDGETAGAQFNLALALWQTGDLPGAEQAVEKYAMLAGAPREDLHYGLLGAVRFGEAKAMVAEAEKMGAGAMAPPTPTPAPTSPSAPPPDPLPKYEAALQKAEQARDHFVRAGTAPMAAPEVQRNVERSLRLVEELQKKIEELKKQREQQKKDQQQKDDKKDDKDKKDDQKSDDKKSDDKKSDDKSQPKQEQKPDDKKPDDKKSEPQKDPEQGKDQQPKPEPGKDEKQPEPKDQQQAKPAERNDAPGEQQDGKQLTPEQTQRLLEELQKMDATLKDYRARVRETKKKGVEKDW